jgi:hypothetical protein
MVDLKALRARATRPRRTVPVLLDGEVREQIEAVEDALDRLEDAPVKDRRLGGKSQEKALREDLARLRAGAEESTLYVVLEGMQRTAYRALIAAHPAEGKAFDPETFTPALVKACIVGYRERPDADAPVLTDWPSADYVAWLVDEHVSPGQLDKLSLAAMELCRGDDAVPLPRKRSATPDSDAE